MPPHTSYARLTALATLVAMGVLAGSCSKGPTDPSDNVVETFRGTVATGVSQKGEHQFNISNNGELFITLVSLQPPNPSPSLAFAVLALGSFGGANCVYDGTVQTTGTFLSLPAREGSFCVVVASAQAAGFTVAETYEIQVSHP